MMEFIVKREETRLVEKSSEHKRREIGTVFPRKAARGTTRCGSKNEGSPTPKAWPRGLFLRNPNPPQRALSLLLSPIVKHELATVEIEMD
ncbi:hypothetical protein ACSQ67_025371 [Phaseolus vulgaris]